MEVLFVAKQLDMNALAARGATVRLAELEAEIAALRAAFPGLGGSSGRRGGNGAATRGAQKSGRSARRRPAMTAAQKRAVSVRMKKYWAERRKAKSASAK
jgi:hypothetical protein